MSTCTICAYCGDPKAIGPVTPGPREPESEALPICQYPIEGGYVTWLCKECQLSTIELIEALLDLPAWEETA